MGIYYSIEVRLWIEIVSAVPKMGHCAPELGS